MNEFFIAQPFSSKVEACSCPYCWHAYKTEISESGIIYAGICLQILLECSDIPILGICLGHQVIY